MRRKAVFIMLCTLFSMAEGFLFASGNAQKKKLTIAGVVFQDDQYMNMVTLGYKAAAKEAGVNLLLANTDNDQGEEAETVNGYIRQGIKGIVIAPLNPVTSIPLLEKASEHMKIVAVGQERLDAPFLTGGFACDNRKLGELTGKAAGEFIKKHLGGKARIAVVQYKAQLAEQSARRVNGFLDAVHAVCPDIKVAADKDAWLLDTAVVTVGQILSADPSINVIFAANAGATIGAVMGVKNTGLTGRCFVFGIDTGQQEAAMLRDKDNILQAVAGQEPFKTGCDGMKLLIDALNGKDTSAHKGKITIIPGILLSREDSAGIDAWERELKTELAEDD
jgi:simple sugar transport system substrate-binding protein/ribose transport system substrate-binding protein